MTNAVYFDLDGTLTDSAPGIFNAIKYLQQKEGLRELTSDELRSCVGPPLTGSFMRLWNVDLETAGRFLSVYREYYTVTGIFENSVFGGIEDTLKALLSMGFECRICSAKPLTMVHTVLDHFGLKNYFTDITGATLGIKNPSKGEMLRQSLEKSPANAVMVGDRRDDIEAGNFCDIPTIGVLWGYGSREELENAGASFTAQNPNDIITAVNAVFD